MSASTTHQVYYFASKDPFYEQTMRNIIYKYSTRKYFIDEFRQNLWLTILQMPKEKIITAWNHNWFKYLWLNVVQNLVGQKKFGVQSILYFDKKTTQINFDLHDDDDHIGCHHNVADALTVNDNREEEIIRTEQSKINQQTKKQKLDLINTAMSDIVQANPHLIAEIGIFKLRYFDGLTFRAISKKTNIPLCTTHDYFVRAETMIKQQIENKKK